MEDGEAGRVRAAAAAAAALEPGSGNGKRAQADGTQSDSEDDLEAALAKIKGEIVSELNASTQSLLDKKLDATASALKNYTDKKCGKIDDKLEAMRKEVEGVGARQNKVDADQKGMWAAISDMQKALAISDSTSRPSPAGASSASSSHEVIDKKILRINTTNFVDYDALLAELKKICDDADVTSDKYELKGGQLAKPFTLILKGDPDTAARRVQKVRTSMRKEGDNGTTTWTDVFVRPPDGVPEKVYISLDKTKSAERREMCTKTLAALLNKSKPNETFTIVKKEFTVTHNWKPIGTVEYMTPKRDTSNGSLPPRICASTLTTSMLNSPPNETRKHNVFNNRSGARNAPRPSLVAGNLSRLSCTTWNARALFHTDPVLAK